MEKGFFIKWIFYLGNGINFGFFVWFFDGFVKFGIFVNIFREIY